MAAWIPVIPTVRHDVMGFAAPFAAFVVTAVVLRVLLLPAARRWFLDQPNQRSLHVSPVPRTGGLGVLPGLTTGWFLVSADPLPLLLALGLMALSLFDDWKDLPPGMRLIGHLAAAGAFVLFELGGLRWFELALLLLAVGWMTNLYNFMDGADGLAGGMAVFGFGTYAVAAWMAGQESLALSCASVAAAAAGFLLFNFPPARMFMGDAGSVPLGFLAAALGLVGWHAGVWPLWFPALVFAPFVIDASVTLVRRALRGEKVWQAHREHYYQRQVLMGWSHRKLAMAEYLLMFATAATALVSLGLQPAAQVAVLGALACAYLAVGMAIDQRWRARRAVRT